jgi:putative ABC transport system permease protein
LKRLVPDLPVYRLETMDELIAASHNGERNRTVLVGAFASAAVLLVLVGLYGVISRSVSQRTRELGIRIAIGARPREVIWLVLRQSLHLAITGVLIGCIATLAATRLITSLLFGITATDISTYAMIAASLIAMSLAATYVPARRAARIDPAECLRPE